MDICVTDLIGLLANDETSPAAEWTTEEDCRLLEALDRGEPLNALAQEVDRPQDDVSARIRALRVEGRYVVPDRHGTRWTPEEDALVRRLASQGLSLRDIGQQVMRTAGAIRLRLEPPSA